MGDDDLEHPGTSRYPRAGMTPVEFEEFVAELLGNAASQVERLQIRLHDRVSGADGTYDFDATVRYRFAGLDFLVVVEAKHHRNPIKRELVQILHSKLASVGAHKAVLIASAPFQRGALQYAFAHNIALVTVTEGRFTYVTRAAGRAGTREPPALTRDEADALGLPTFVGHAHTAGSRPNSTRVTLLGTPEVVAELLGVPRPTPD